MTSRFKCKFCGATGDSYLSVNVTFPHCPWYEDKNGLHHGCIYCRSCGTIYDTVGSLIAPIKMLLGRMPSKVIGSIDFESMIKITAIGNPGIPNLRSVHPVIINAIEEDGRLNGREEIDREPTREELKQYLSDKNKIVRRGRYRSGTTAVFNLECH